MAQKMQKAIMEELDNGKLETLERLASFDSKQFHDVKVFHGVEKTHGRRFIRWRFSKNIDFDLTSAFMGLIKKSVSRSFYMKYVFQYQLRNIENDDILQHYYQRTAALDGLKSLNRPKNGLVSAKMFALTMTLLKDQTLTGFLKVFLKSMSRLYLIINLFWVQENCLIGCAIFLTVGTCFLLTLITTIFVFGGVWPFIMVLDQIGAHQLQGC